jgi:hypothetical protein
MAIDILSRSSVTPIIVGDQADLNGYDRCSVAVFDGRASLDLSKAALSRDQPDENLHTNLTFATAINFLRSEFVVLVNLSPDDQITKAILVPINDSVSQVRTLREPEIKDIAEDLVSTDFRLDFIR